ncbi:MAG: complex I subunit 4 family protein [Gammaproteobacteria bacterium]
MISMPFPILSLVIFLPLAGAIACGCLTSIRMAKWTALFVAGLELIVALLIMHLFDEAQGDRFQFVEKYAWIPYLNIEYFIGIDGISVLFLPFSALLTLTSLLATWNSAAYLPRFHLALLLALEGITMGVFVALDLILFFLFWELTLPPIFFLIGLWGIGAERRSAAMKYMLFMLFGGISLLFGIIILALNHAAEAGGSIPQQLAFSLPVLLDTVLPDNLQKLVFLLLFVGFIVKAPLVPFHTWLPFAVMEGPAHMSALLTGLKLGAFGLIRFAMPLAPSAAVEGNWLLGILGAITLIYSGLIALHQSNLRRLLAYASVSHIGLIIIGLASLNVQGIQGAIFQLLNFTLTASSLMLISGFIQLRMGSTEALHLGGLAKVMPRLAFFYFLFMLASIGMPGTNGFPAELLLIISALLSHPSLGITALAGAVLGAAYMLNYSRKAFFGPIVHANVSQAQDLRSREIALLSVPALLVVILGLLPNAVLKINAAAAEAWVTRLMERSVIESAEGSADE